jgi:hypothetical protein
MHATLLARLAAWFDLVPFLERTADADSHGKVWANPSQSNCASHNAKRVLQLLVMSRR